jgi:hypothetical protein
MKELNLGIKKEITEDLTESKKEKKSLITLSTIKKHFMIPLLYAIFNYLYDFFEKKFDDTEVLKNTAFIKSIIYDLHNVCAGLFYFVPHFQVNVDVNTILDYKEKPKLIRDYFYSKNLQNKDNSKTIKTYILILSLMFAIDDLFWVIILYENTLEPRLFHLIFIPLFSKIILKEKIYKHQYFSLLITLIGYIFLIIPVFLNFSDEDIIPNIMNFIQGINFPLFLVLVKNIVEKYYVPPLKISLIIGISTLSINIIGYTIYSLINDLDFKYFTDIFDFSNVENTFEIIIYFLLFFIFATATQLTLFLSVFYFSPTLIMVTGLISPILMFISNYIIDEYSLTEIILNSIGYLITLFSTLIYNEIIIFNCWGLNKETKKFVNKRIDEELEEIQKFEKIYLSEKDNDDDLIDDIY